MQIVDSRQLACWRDRVARLGDVSVEHGAFQARFHRVSQRYEPIIYPLPMFAPSFLADLVRSGRAVLDLVLSIPERVFKGDYAAWLRFQGWPQEEAAFLRRLSAARCVETATQFARPDCLLTPDGFRIVEVNIAPPIGGLAGCERIVREFRATAFAQQLEDENMGFGAPDTLALWGRALRGIARASAGAASPLFFEALADPAEVETPNAQHADFVQGVLDCGFRHCRGNVKALRIGADGVYFEGQRVDLVFTAFTYAELHGFNVPHDLVLELASLDQAGLVDFIAPPINIVFDDKCNLELLTDPDHVHHWTHEERQLIDRVLPRTQRLRKDRLAAAIERRASLVLKPARQFGGVGVVAGENCGDAQWANELDKALASGEPYVMQEAVRPLYRHDVDLGRSSVEYEVCAGPMYFGNEDAGVLLRLMPARDGVVPVINAARGALVGAAISIAA